MERLRASAATALGGMVLLIVALMASAAAAGPADMPPPQESAEDARGRAADILARPEFRPEPRSVVERILDKLGELLGRIAADVGGGNPGLAWAAVAAVSVLLATLLWRAVRALQVDVGSVSGVSVDGRRRPPADWRAEADGHAAAGRWREALRCSWRAVVADLAALGLVEEVPGRTTGEYRARVARSVPGGAEHFDRATRLFEDAWYAAVDIGQEEAAEVRALGDRVLAEARRRT